MGEQDGILLRTQLYNEIWEVAVTGVSKKYSVPYHKLLNVCKLYNIPIPQAGYWTKISYGKQVEKTPLPEQEDIEIDLIEESAMRQKKKNENSSLPKTSEATHPPEKTELTVNEIKQNQQAEALIPYKLVRDIINVYTRDNLYEEVWSKPVVEVAAQYGVSDATILKTCKTLAVPVPPRGYWAKVRAGEAVHKPSLKPTKGILTKVGPRTYEGTKVVQVPIKVEKLAFLDEDEKQRLFLAAEQISMPADNAVAHKKIIAYGRKIKKDNGDTKAEGIQRSSRSYSEPPQIFSGGISEKTLPRAFRILDALIQQVENLGGGVNDDLSLTVRKEQIYISIQEEKDQVAHVMTKKEARDLLVYEDAMRHHTWASKPRIFKYDDIYSGRLKIGIRKGKYFRDKGDLKIESQLGEMLIELYEESEAIRIVREDREEDARKREEEERQREEQRKRYDSEVERTSALQNESVDYSTASRIRAYVNAVKENAAKNELDNELTAWIDWATKKADWYDPTVARKDEIFGVRDHAKNSEQKTLVKYHYW